MSAQLVSQNQRFERVEVTREEALSMFQENKFKVQSTVHLGGHPNPRCDLLGMAECDHASMAMIHGVAQRSWHCK